MKKPPRSTTLVNQIHRLPISEADARLFVSVAESGSFTAAATLHSLTPSAISRAVSRLESDLGVRLLARTTRALHLTDEGMAFRDRCARAFALLAEAAEEASARNQTAHGTVRIGLPTLFGTFLVAPQLCALREQHPRLRVEIVSTMRLSDLVDRGLDLMIAVGALPDSSFAARPLGTGRFVTVASPRYLARRGEPSAVDDLLRHEALTFARADGREDPWFFSDGGPRALTPASVATSDDMHHLAAMAVAGAGIAQLPQFVVEEHLVARRLQRLLRRFEPEPKPAWIVLPARAIPRRVRAVVELLTSTGATLPGTRAGAKQRGPHV